MLLYSTLEHFYTICFADFPSFFSRIKHQYSTNNYGRPPHSLIEFFGFCQKFATLQNLFWDSCCIFNNICAYKMHTLYQRLPLFRSAVFCQSCWGNFLHYDHIFLYILPFPSLLSPFLISTVHASSFPVYNIS